MMKINDSIERINRSDTVFRVFEENFKMQIIIEKDSSDILIIRYSSLILNMEEEYLKASTLRVVYHYLYPEEQTYIIETSIRLAQIVSVTLAMTLLNRINNGQYLTVLIILSLLFISYLNESYVQKEDLDLIIEANFRKIRL